MNRNDLDRYLETMFGRAPEGFVCVSWKTPGGLRTKCFPVGQLDEVAEHICSMSKKSDVYVRTTVVGEKPKRGRGGSELTSWVSSFFLDIDVKVGAFESKEDALEWIETLHVDPTMVVESGNGLHVYWNLEEPISVSTPDDLERVRRLLKGWEQYCIKQLPSGVKMDSVAEPARILRPPGTKNHKNPQRPLPVDILWQSEKRIRLADLESHLAPDKRSHSGRVRTRTSATSPSTISPVATAWTSDLVARFKKSAEACPELESLMNGHGEFKSQSEREFRLAILAARAGWQDENELVALIAEARHRSGTHIEKADRPAYLRDTAKKALEAAAKSTCPELTDLGNAERLRILADGGVLRCEETKKTYVWDDTAFAQDLTNLVHGLAARLPELVREELNSIHDDERRKATSKWARTSQSRARQEAAVELFLRTPSIQKRAEDFDRDPWLLNVRNGTIDLRTGQLRGHSRDDLITKTIRVEYDAEAQCPLFHGFLRRILPDRLTREYIQRLAGYMLLGIQREAILPIFLGAGANGKSVLANTLMALLGPYAGPAPADLLKPRTGERHPVDLADIDGKRLVVVSEWGEGQAIDELRVKTLTGGDRIRARGMRENFRTIEVQATCLVLANHMPETNATDHGFWRRIVVIPFGVRIPEHEQDLDLEAKLKEELPGILAWAVEGCVSYLEDGLLPPANVVTASAEFRDEADHIGTFLHECCVRKAGEVTPTASLRNAYEPWCEARGIQPLSPSRFTHALKAHGFKKRDRSQFRGWESVALLPGDTSDASSPMCSHHSGETDAEVEDQRGKGVTAVTSVTSPPLTRDPGCDDDLE